MQYFLNSQPEIQSNLKDEILYSTTFHSKDNLNKWRQTKVDLKKEYNKENVNYQLTFDENINKMKAHKYEKKINKK